MDLRYWARGARALGRNLRHKAFVKELVDSGLVAEYVLPRATSVPFLVAYPKAQGLSVPMGQVTYRTFNLDPMEQYCVAALAMLRQPKTIFEFGTYDGATTLLLARAAPQAKVFTLDLPPDAFGSPESFLPAELQVDPGPGGDGPPGEIVGARFRGTPEAARITQLLGDSRSFDIREYLGAMDMVLVDGGHDEECVSADTESAFRMVRDGGLVIWDDYSRLWAHVVRTVDDTAARLGRPLVRIAPTELAVYDPELEELATKSYWARASARGSSAR